MAKYIIKPQRKITLTLLLCVFLCTGLVAYFVIKDTVKKTIESQAVAFAEIAAVQATTARSVYAKEIAEKLRQDGSGPDVDYGHMKGYVPIPAQFLKMLGLASTANTSDLFHYKPVSKWNLEPSQGLDDDFLNWAWPQIEQQDNSNPTGPIKWKPVWRFEQEGEQRVLRYLRPDAASQSSCVNCHNSYENKPEIIARRNAAHVPAGKQWKQHQLLGAISITIPLRRVEAIAAARVRDTSILIFGILLASLCLAIVFSRRLSQQETTLGKIEHDLRRSEKEAQDAKELLLAKQDVERAFNELSTYLQAIDQHASVFVTDLQGLTIQVNHKYCEISGYSQEEVLGQNQHIVNSGYHSKAFYDEMWSSIAAGKIWHAEYCNRAKSGALYWVDSTIVPNKDLDGQIFQYISIQLDITERKQAEEALKAAKLNAETANEKLRVLLNRNMDDLMVANGIMSHIMRSDGLNDPQIRYYQCPTQQFSGDIIAVARDGNGDLRIMLADVTGHGLQAALFLLPVSRVFYSMVKKGFLTGEIVRELNKTMREISVTGRFIAAAVAHINCSDTSIEIWNGGIPTAFHLQNKGVLHNFKSQHLPLGVLKEEAFDSATEIYKAQPGDAFILCSDGLSEAENSSGEAFGDVRLEAILQTSLPDELYDNILSALETHLGGAIAHDDLSIVLARFNH